MVKTNTYIFFQNKVTSKIGRFLKIFLTQMKAYLLCAPDFPCCHSQSCWAAILNVKFKLFDDIANSSKKNYPKKSTPNNFIS